MVRINELTEITTISDDDVLAITDTSENKDKKVKVVDLRIGAGDVAGPSSSTDENLAIFDSTTGKLIKDGGVNISAVNDNTAKRTYPPADETKVAGIEAGAEVNVQADWNEADSGADAYIKNKPSLATGDMTKAVYDTNDNGKVDTSDALILHEADTTNPHSVTKTQVGLADVPNLDTTDAVANEHTHANKALLDTYDQTNTNLTSAVDLKHTHSNKTILDNITASFTSAEETKLSGIETGAEVNNISDTNATDLTDSGDSSLHYHSTDRARANHTGTQTASTISDFDTEVSNNSRVTANTAKVSNATHTGDVTGSTVLTLATVNSNIGSFNSADITVNAKGLVTAAADGTAGSVVSIGNLDRIAITDYSDGGKIRPGTQFGTGTTTFLRNDGTWATAGGEDPMWECTVGASGADYTTLGAAITASKVRILLIDDTTETGDITLPNACIIQGIGIAEVNINMGTYKFSDNSGVNKNIKFSDLEITWSSSTNSVYLFQNFNSLYLTRVKIDNNSTATNRWYECQSGSDLVLVIKDCIIELPNSDNKNINISATPTFKMLKIDGLTIEGGGTSCAAELQVRTPGNLSNIFFTGTYGSLYYATWFKNCNVSNIEIATTSIIRIALENNVTISNINAENGSQLYLSHCYDTNISNFYTRGMSASYPIYAGNSYSINLTNINADGLAYLASTCKLINLSNSNILDGVDLRADNSSLSNCRVGADAGGGSKTITISADATNTIISGCRTDAAISDSGTSSSLTGNVVY